MMVLVCGSRRFQDPLAASVRLITRMAAIPSTVTVIHGDAPGADRTAANAARLRGCEVIAYPANWEEHAEGCGCTEGKLYCKKAGLRRNLLMLDQEPDLVLAFWNLSSHGTKHTITEARRRGIPVEVIAL